MRRIGRQSDPARLDVNLTPLLDVVLQLITFFMMLIHFGTRIEGANASIRLPEAPAALPSGDLGLERLAVGIDAEGRLIVDDLALEGRSADAFWDDEAGRRRIGQALLGAPGQELPTQVVIRADRGVAFGVLRRVLASAQRRGFARFTLVVLREERR